MRRNNLLLLLLPFLLVCSMLTASVFAEGDSSAAAAGAGDGGADTSVSVAATGSDDASAGAAAAEAGDSSSSGGADTSVSVASTGSDDASAAAAAAQAGDPASGVSTSAVSASTEAGGSGSSSSSSSSTTSTTTTTTTTTTSSSSSSTTSSGSAAAGAAASGGSSSASSSSAGAGSGSHSGSGSHHSGSRSYLSPEYIIQSTPVTGKGWTVIGKVNVRAMASIRSSWITRIRYANTEMEVTARVINSSGETWYAVRLYSGLVGYIRGDLLRVDIQPVQVQAAEPEVIVRQSPGTGSNILVYVVVDPSLLQSGSEPQVIFVTPEQAAQMGIV